MAKLTPRMKKLAKVLAPISGQLRKRVSYDDSRETAKIESDSIVKFELSGAQVEQISRISLKTLRWQLAPASRLHPCCISVQGFARLEGIPSLLR